MNMGRSMRGEPIQVNSSKFNNVGAPLRFRIKAISPVFYLYQIYVTHKHKEM